MHTNSTFHLINPFEACSCYGYLETALLPSVKIEIRFTNTFLVSVTLRPVVSKGVKLFA